MPIDWSSVTMVFTVEMHCPECLAIRPIVIRTEQAGDGSKSRKCICRKCSEAFLVVIEPPVPIFGKSADVIRKLQ